MQSRERPLHFGVQLQAQRTSWAEYAAAVQAVEKLGYGSVWTFDHLLPFSGADDGPCFETLTTLSALALLTERVRRARQRRPLPGPGHAGQGRGPGRRDQWGQARFLPRGGLGGT